jgi:hypothetical protein
VIREKAVSAFGCFPASSAVGYELQALQKLPEPLSL